MVTGSMIRYCKRGRSRRTPEMADGFPPTEGMCLMNGYSIFKVQYVGICTYSNNCTSFSCSEVYLVGKSLSPCRLNPL